MAMPKKNKAEVGRLMPMAPGKTMKIMGEANNIRAMTRMAKAMEAKVTKTVTPILIKKGPIKINPRMIKTNRNGDFLF